MMQVYAQIAESSDEDLQYFMTRLWMNYAVYQEETYSSFWDTGM